MIDWSRVEELRDEIGEDGLAEVVGLFLEEVEEALLGLNHDDPPRTLAAQIHFLKGCAWNLGFREFGAVCHDCERAALDGRCDGASVGGLRDCYARSRVAFLSGLATGGRAA